MNNIIFLMEYKMLSGIKGESTHTSIYFIVECTLTHTHTHTHTHTVR